MLTPGIFVADRYEVISKVGAGGMSDVYKAKDHILGREVAIKILKQEFSEDATFVAKFRTEAQSAAGLEHPNIVNIYDVGSENGMYFIVMEYVEGITLKTYIEKKGQLNFKEAISIAIQVGRGIEAAHLKGIIHRDIKPQNIIISTEGKVKVTDFGIARAASSNTIHADVMGSVHYSSPEQARNGFVDGKSDIYSLGIVMYEMVTGRVPFDGDNTVAIAIQHLQEEMVAPSAYAPDLPISLEKIILKATQKSPDRRYATITDMLMDLKKALVSPNEDFVTLADNSLEKTVVISRKDEEALSNRAAKALIEDDEYDDEYDDDDYDDDDYDDDDYEDDDYDDDSKMDKAMTIMGVVAGIAIIAIVVAILGNVFGLFNFNFGSKDSVTMINVVGEQYDAALSDLSELGLDADNISVTYVSSDEYDEGTVAEQSVAADEEFSLDDKLELSVVGEKESSSDDSSSSDSSSDESTDTSDSAEQVTMPTVVGLSQKDATDTLQNIGLTVTGTTEVYSATVAEGDVVTQSVEAGATVDSSAQITLEISKGPGYSFTFTNPCDGDITYSFMSNTGSLGKGQTMSFEYSAQTVDLTYSYTPVWTSEDGTVTQGEAETTTTTLYGTAIE